MCASVTAANCLRLTYPTIYQVNANYIFRLCERLYFVLPFWVFRIACMHIGVCIAYMCATILQWKFIRSFNDGVCKLQNSIQLPIENDLSNHLCTIRILMMWSIVMSTPEHIYIQMGIVLTPNSCDMIMTTWSNCWERVASQMSTHTYTHTHARTFEQLWHERYVKICWPNVSVLCDWYKNLSHLFSLKTN